MGGDVAMEAALARPERVAGFIGVDYFKNVGQALPKEQTEQQTFTGKRQESPRIVQYQHRHLHFMRQFSRIAFKKQAVQQTVLV